MKGRIGWLIPLAALAAALTAGGCKESEKTVFVPTPGVITIPPNLQDLNIIDYHLNITAGSQNSLCVACHGDMTDRQATNPTVKTFHAFKHEKLRWVCTDCHGEVDLLNKSGANIRKHVDVEARCYPCHGPGASATQLYQ